jgi:hypothetical protein
MLHGFNYQKISSPNFLSAANVNGKIPSVKNFGKFPKRPKGKFTTPELLGKFPPITQKYPLSAKQEMFRKIKNSLHCKKRLPIFPSSAGMSLIKLSLAGN